MVFKVSADEGHTWGALQVLYNESTKQASPENPIQHRIERPLSPLCCSTLHSCSSTM